MYLNLFMFILYFLKISSECISEICPVVFVCVHVVFPENKRPIEFQDSRDHPDKVTVKMGNHQLDATDDNEVGGRS